MEFVIRLCFDDRNARRLRFSVFAAGLLILCLPSWASAKPEFGFLQFKVQHNIETESCLATGDCFLQIEETQDINGWLNEIGARSDLAVLHWDRGIPWLIFDADPPVVGDRVAYYDALVDPSTVSWLNSFKAQFSALGRGYLAVSILSGERDRLAPLYLGQTDQIPFANACPDFSPGTQVTVNAGTGPTSFDLARSYRNFVLYLMAKLNPDYVGLMVEVNVIESLCPASAAGLYELYRALHDQVELEVGTTPLLFATLSLTHLLDYQRSACFPTASFLPCGSPPAPSPPNAGVELCYPTSTNAIQALNLGGRLDVLALSFYPDALEMNPVPPETMETQAYLLEDWNSGGECLAALSWPNRFDPLVAIDQLGWAGPIAFAETSARSCRSPLRFNPILPGENLPTQMVFELAGSASSQAAWVGSTYQHAVDRDYLFFAHSFLQDYQPVGPWTVEQGVLPIEVQQLFNLWPCSGFLDLNGQEKPEMEMLDVPEPGFNLGIMTAFLVLLALRKAQVGMSSDQHKFPRRESSMPPF